MLASIFSLNVIQTALELGCIYALVADVQHLTTLRKLIFQHFSDFRISWLWR